MKLSEARDAYYTHSQNASAVVRSLAFAGLATTWIFKVGAGNESALPLEFVPAAFFLVATLAADFLQYASASLIWGAFHRFQERKLTRLSSNPDVSAPTWMNWPALVFFWGKMLGLGVAYWYLLGAIWERWF